MTSEGLGEMFEGDSADTCAGKFPLVSMGGRAEGLACADPGARTPIGASGNLGNIDGKPTQSNIKLDRLLDYLWKEVQILATHIAATTVYKK